MAAAASASDRDQAAQLRAPRAWTRAIGLLYVVIAILAAFAEAYVRDGMIVPGDAAATAANIIAHQPLYRAAGLADAIVLACDVAVAILLYRLLKPVNRTLALLAAAFRLSLVAVNGVAVLLHMAPLLLLGGGAWLSGFRPDQLQALALLSLKLHSTAYSVAILFFGIHCLLAGYLIYRSHFLPRLLGLLWMLAGTFYLAHSSVSLLAIPIAGADLLLLVAGLSELAIIPCFLFVGIKADKWPGGTHPAPARASAPGQA
jgi:hypothetical protein